LRIVQDLIDELQDPSITRYEELNRGFSTAKKYLLYSKDDVPNYILKYTALKKQRDVKLNLIYCNGIPIIMYHVKDQSNSESMMNIKFATWYCHILME
jgi:hypothetical protein